MTLSTDQPHELLALLDQIDAPMDSPFTELCDALRRMLRPGGAEERCADCGWSWDDHGR